MARKRPLAFDPIEEARRHWDRLGWQNAAAGMALVTSVMRVQQILLARVEDELRPFGLTFARYEVLMLLTFSRSGRLPMGKVGERLQVHPASVTNAIDRLERQGLVRRVPNPDDRRGTLAELTSEGRDTAARATDAVNTRVFSVLGGVTERDADVLVKLLRKLRAAEGDFV